MLDKLLTFTVSGLILAAFLTVLVVGLAEEIAQQPVVDRPDPTFEMVDDQWATLRIPGYRQSWGKPSMVTRMTIYEPGEYMQGEKDYAVFWVIGQKEFREDFDTRENAVKLVEFIIANSKAEQ